MAEPLKNRYTCQMLGEVAEALSQACPAFEPNVFFERLFEPRWEAYELKERMGHIAVCLHECLPKDLQSALKALMAASHRFEGFEYMFFSDYVERFGLDDFKTSMETLEHFTKSASAEFAVRPFLLKFGDRMLKQMLKWSKSKDARVRRLASEGTRPRLPWAMALPDFKRDPRPCLPILERLKNDEDEVVRRSVANHLNDISKDHPDLLMDCVHEWLGESKEVDRMLKHASRTLLKQGRADAMLCFGYASPDHIRLSSFTCDASVSMGQRLHFEFRLETNHGALGKIRLEYALYFLRGKGEHSRKVFKISELDETKAAKTVAKDHAFKPISTRRYYNGLQRLGVICNGVELAQKDFELRGV